MFHVFFQLVLIRFFLLCAILLVVYRMGLEFEVFLMLLAGGEALVYLTIMASTVFFALRHDSGLTGEGESEESRLALSASGGA